MKVFGHFPPGRFDSTHVMNGAVDASMCAAGWFITVQPKTGTPAGCRGVLAPIQFALRAEQFTCTRHSKRLTQPRGAVKTTAGCATMISMQTEPACDLSIVIVSWNVWPLLQRCLASLAHATAPGAGSVRWLQPVKAGAERDAPGKNVPSPVSTLQLPAALEVIVVDNASADETPAQIAAHFPWVRVIASDRNLGFTGGNNRGYAASRGRFVYFLNPDTEVGGAGGDGDGAKHEAPRASAGDQERPAADGAQSLHRLYAAIVADPAVGVIGPQLRYADDAPQPSARRFPTPLTGFFESTWLGRAWPANPWARTMLMVDWPGGRRGDVDWLVGAALLCRREALAAVATPDGPFDEGFFMYSEEVDLCRRVKAAGWRIVYEPAALVIHHEGKSSEQVSTQRHIRFNTSKVRYWRKWFGPRWAATLRHYLLLEYRVQRWEEQLKLWLGHKPELRRARIAAYQEVIRSGFQPTPPCR